MNTSGQPVVLNDRYELEQRIGRGGMADVFLARDQLLNRQVAIKVLFPEFATDPNFVERFRREAQSAANLNHPNIVSVYDWGQYSNTYFMAMEYVRGRTLADILKANGHINSVQAAEIASEIAAAVGHAHRNGVVHRDIKPANILIGANGQVKVADFGIARAMNSAAENNLTQVGNVMGTASYFSPEQAQGAQPDPRSDLYSIGVVLYEMVAGRPPFVGDNPVSIAYKQVHDTPQPLHQIVADVPRSYEAIVAKLLAKQPAQRYPSSEALRDDLRRFRNGEPVQALGAGAAPSGPAPVPSPPNATLAMPPTAAMPGAPHGVTAAPTMAPRQMAPRPKMDQYLDIDDTERRGSWYAVLGFVALLALVGGGVFLFTQLRNDGESGPTSSFAPIPMPNVVGLPLEEAVKVISDAGLSYKAEPETEPTDVAEGQVSRTLPSAGLTIIPPDTVIIYFRPLSQKVEVPAVVGLTLDEATAALSAAGFTVGRTDSENSPTVEEGRIIRSDPAEGTLLSQGEPVNLVVSGGLQKVAVPATQLLSEADATAALTAEPFGFNVVVEQQESTTVPAGQAIGTTPAAGELVDPGSEVKLIISTGKPLKTVPGVIGLTEAQARNLLSQNGLDAVVNYVAVDAGSPQDGIVVAQSVDENQKVEAGTTITLEVGQGVATTPAPTTLPDDTVPPTDPTTTTSSTTTSVPTTT